MGHVNLLSWLQEQDYDVWLYLYENYLVHVMNHKKMLSQVHRPLHFKKMFKNLQVENAYDSKNFCESRSYALYVGGKYSIHTSHGGYGAIFAGHGIKYYIAGLPLRTRELYSWQTAVQHPGQELCHSKNDLIEKCKECEVHYRKSWNKDKLIRALMDHPDS